MKFNFLTLHILKAFAKVIRPSYRFDWSAFDWQHDTEFNNYLQTFGELHGFNTQRRFMVKQLLRLVTNVPGHTAECGVFAGAGSQLVCDANRASPFDKIHHMFDSFEGLSKPSRSLDGTHWEVGDLSCSLEIVKSRFAGYSVEFHKGWIPTQFKCVEEESFSFVHVDVDLYQPTKDSIEFFYPRMSRGGIMLFDDYGFDTCPGATKTIDCFFGDKVEKPIALSSGGAFVLIGTHVPA